MLTLSIIFLIISNAISTDTSKSILFNRVAIIILFYTSIIAINSLYFDTLNNSIGLFNDLFKTKSLLHFLQIFIYISAAIILQLTAYYPRSLKFIPWISHFNTNIRFKNTFLTDIRDEKFKLLEYPLIILFILLGATLLTITNDIISMFLSIELQSYGLYLLATIYRNSENATLAGLTYFLLGGLASCFILLGSSIIYINTGITNLDDIFVLLSNLNNSNINNNLYIFITLSFSIILIGYLFKVSSAPFHFWSPDVYDGVPTIVTAFIAIIPKISIFTFLLMLIHNNIYSSYIFDLNDILLISSFLSLIIGTIAGLYQKKIKKLLAYSTISHIGFILLSLTIDNLESIQAFIFYIVQYTLSNINVFFILVFIGYYTFFYKDISNIKDSNNSPIQYINQLKGFIYKNYMICLSLAITLFSFSGIPPFIGFFGKQLVLNVALQNGYIFISIIAILTSVISAFYYLSIVKIMFFELNKSINIFTDIKSIYKSKLLFSNNIQISAYLSFTISLLTLIILLYIFYPQILINFLTLCSLNIINI